MWNFNFIYQPMKANWEKINKGTYIYIYTHMCVYVCVRVCVCVHARHGDIYL
jgi:hypothetical protein